MTFDNARFLNHPYKVGDEVAVKNAPADRRYFIDTVARDRGGPMCLCEWWDASGSYHCRWFRYNVLMPV